jgi:hypothetical protein
MIACRILSAVLVTTAFVAATPARHAGGAKARRFCATGRYVRPGGVSGQAHPCRLRLHQTAPSPPMRSGDIPTSVDRVEKGLEFSGRPKSRPG